jgi:hypothetical protein
MQSAESASELEHELTKSLVASRLFGDGAGVQVGRLRLTRYLGHGAVGVVYEAIDPERGAVAVKVLGRADGRGVYRVKQEFRSIAGLQHPNLVMLHELVHDRGHWFFSMELVDGVPFDRWARSSGQVLDEVKLRCALRQLASAVCAIHASGKLHRDLKPSNVLVTRDGVVKVLDFGLVSDHVDGSATPDTGLAGTPEYVAPEQAAGAPASPASDWYAVGVILYRILAGRSPFEGDAFKVLQAKQRDAAPPLTAPRAVDDLQALCERLLLRDPAQRAGASDVLATLNEGEDAASAPSVAPTAGSVRPVFVGREVELERLRGALRAVGTDSSSIVLVGGPSGIGKSALLDRFASELDDDVLVLRGRCYEQESLPYKVFDAVIDALSRHLRTCTAEQVQLVAPRNVAALMRLFPVLARVEALESATRVRLDEPGELRAQAFAAAKELLLRLTDQRRVVIMVDDLQWGDLDSARMMTRVLGPPEPPPLLFIGAYRDDETHEEAFVDTLLDERMDGNSWHAQRLALAPLSQQAAMQLAGQLLVDTASSVDAPDVDEAALAVAKEAAGMPFFITELAARVAERRALHEPYSAPASLEEAVLDRVRALPQACHELLEVLAVASEPIETKVALTAAGVATSERSFLSALRSARLVRSHGMSSSERIEIDHDRIRAILSSRTPPVRARELHGRIAAAMELHGVRDPDRLVVHYIGALDHAQAARTAISAAHAAAAKLAFNRAAELYERGLELLPHADPQVPGLRVSLADALANAGRGAPASEQYLLAAAAELEPTAARQLQLKAAQQCFKSGLTARGFELAEPLLRRHGVSLQGSQSTLIARLLVERGRIRVERAIGLRPTEPDANGAERLATLGGLFQELMVSDQLRGAILHGAFLRHAMRQPDVLLQLKAQVWECAQTAWLGGRNSEKAAEAIYRGDVMRLRRQVETPYAQALEHLAASVLYQHTARYAVGFEHGRKARELFEQCPGTYWERAHSALVEFACAEYVGDLRAITVAAPELARAAAEREDDGALMQVTFSTALVRLAHDQPEPTLAFLKNRLALLGPQFSIFHYLATHRIADCLIYLGRGQEALDFVQARWRSITSMLVSRSPFIRAVISSLRARVAVSAYAQSRDRNLLPLIRSDLKQLRHGYGGMGLALRGALHHLEGDRSAAIASLELGIAQLEAEGIERFLHCARRRLGELSGGERGAELVAQADASMRRQEVKRPELFTNVMMADLGDRF